MITTILSLFLSKKISALDSYILSKCPKSIYDIEKITRDYYYNKGW